MLKRNKIKNKYLNALNKPKENISDKTEKIILKSLITFGLILLLLCWNAIPLIILKLLNIDPDNMNTTIKVLIAFITDILFLITIISFYFKTIKRDFKNYFLNNFKSNLKESFSTWLIGFGIMVISNVIISLLTNGQMSNNEEAIRKTIDMYPLYMLFQTTIYAPISEEIIFRKSIKDITNKKYIYIFISGFIFGGLHVISSLNNHLGFLYLIPYCALGFVFAHLYHKTDNIFSTIMAHSIHNTLAILLYFKGI